MTDTEHVTLDSLLEQAAEAAEGRNGAPAAMAVKMHRLITEAWAGGRAGTAALTDHDRAIIDLAREIGPAFRVRAGDRERLAGWLLKELADLADRLGGA
jgi:hypothetical protein